MKTYYDYDIDLNFNKDETIAIIGYGIQGRAQALNLRDSGYNVIIGNIRGKYFELAKQDKFKVFSIAKATKQATIILFLIPDQAQKTIFNKSIKFNLSEGNLLVFAHGFSLYFNELDIPSNIDVGLLAPRMPGKPIREYYLNNSGVPAFVDIYQDFSNNAWKKLLALAKGIGSTRVGAMHITFKEETEIDLFIEQFFLPLLIKGIRLSFDYLVSKGFTPEAVLMELYASGEIGELLKISSTEGIYKVWQKHASPTCQFGILNNHEKVLQTKKTNKIIDSTLKNIRNRNFLDALNKEAKLNYKNLKKYNSENNNDLITKTQLKINKLLHNE